MDTRVCKFPLHASWYSDPFSGAACYGTGDGGYLSSYDENIYYYADGSCRIETGLLLDSADALPEDLIINITVAATGAALLDPDTGWLETTNSISMGASVLGGNPYPVIYLLAADSWSANCSSLFATQDGAMLGSR